MLFFQLMLDGLGRGAIYAGLGLSIVLIFRCTGVINFAQGEFATLSTYLTFGLSTLGLNIWVAVAISMLISALVAGAVEVVVIRPLLNRSHLVIVTATIALFLAANSISQLVGGPNPKRVPRLFPDHVWSISGVRISASLLGVLIIEALVVLALWFFFNRTNVGLAFRAVATSPGNAPYVGIPVQRILVIGWGVAAALGALVACLLTSIGFYLQSDMMVAALVLALAAVTIGGFDSAGGTIVAGLLLGVLESLFVGYVPGFSSGFGVVFALIAVIAVLLVRPNGLAGSATTSRV